MWRYEMDKQKVMKIIKKIFCLPPVPILLISIPSFIFVFYALTKDTVNPAIANLSYILSAYAMIITVIGIAEIVKWIRKKLLSIPLVEQIITETDLQTEISLYPSLMINLIYAGIKFFYGLHFHSVWFGTLAVYYILLAVMRFSLLYHVRRRNQRQGDYIAELKIGRLCGVILMILDWVLMGIVILVISKDSGFEYPGTLIYVMALYAFYAVITAVKNVIKYRKHESPAIAVTKVINLTAALVSMLSLETAMLTQFGVAGDECFRQRMAATTGMCVSIIVLGMAVYIIAHTTKQIHKKISQEG